MASPSSKSRKAQLELVPVDNLPTEAARLYTHIHPFLLLGIYYLRFNSLTADPVSTLLTSLVPLGILQISYAVVCLPAAKGSSRKPIAAKPARSEQRKKTSTVQPENAFGIKLAACSHLPHCVPLESASNQTCRLL